MKIHQGWHTAHIQNAPPPINLIVTGHNLFTPYTRRPTHGIIFGQNNAVVASWELSTSQNNAQLLLYFN